MKFIINDFSILIAHISDWLFLIKPYVLLLIFVLPFYFQYLSKNYAPYPANLYKLFTPTSLFRYFRYTAFGEMLILTYSHFHQILNVQTYQSYVFTDFVLTSLTTCSLQYCVLFVALIVVAYWLFKGNISKYIIKDSDFRNRRGRYVFFKFFAFSFVAILLQIGMIYLVSMSFSQLDLVLINANFFPVNLLSKYDISQSYHQGVYISIFFSILIVVFLLNAIVKNLNERYHFQDFLMYSFVLVIVGFGLYSGLYSILNYYFNYMNFGIHSDWMNNDKLIGHFSVRITSVILLWSILKFVYKSIFSRNFIANIITGLFPLESDRNSKNLGQLTGNYADYFDLVYFAQVGYYILNVFSAEFLISQFDMDFFSSILFVLLPVMVDDFFAIHVYHKKFGQIDSWHKFKLIMFNCLLAIFSVLALCKENHYVFLILYVLISILLYSVGNQNFRRRQSIYS